MRKKSPWKKLPCPSGADSAAASSGVLLAERSADARGREPRPLVRLCADSKGSSHYPVIPVEIPRAEAEAVGGIRPLLAVHAEGVKSGP